MKISIQKITDGIRKLSWRDRTHLHTNQILLLESDDNITTWDQSSDYDMKILKERILYRTSQQDAEKSYILIAVDNAYDYAKLLEKRLVDKEKK